MSDLPAGYVRVLNNGYVGLVNAMGNDQTVAQSARVSFDKRVEPNADGSLSDKDMRLIAFLWREKHTSTFRHCSLTFEVQAPLMVARQWWKHTVASTYIDDQTGWNEQSMRYSTSDLTFYVPAPDEWRSAPENKKQGSGDNLDEDKGATLSHYMTTHIEECLDMYEYAVGAGVAEEQARLFLPAYALNVKFYWTVSLHGLLHFLELRTEAHSQFEIRQFAGAVKELAKEKFPVSIGLLDG